MKPIDWGWFQSSCVPRACFDWFCEAFDRHEEIPLSETLDKMFETCPLQQLPYDKWVIGFLAWTFQQNQIERKEIIRLLAEWLEPVMSKVYPSLGDPQKALEMLREYSRGEKQSIDEVSDYALVFSAGSRDATLYQQFLRSSICLAFKSILGASLDKEKSYSDLATAIISVAYAHVDLENDDSEAVVANARAFMQSNVIPAIQQLK